MKQVIRDDLCYAIIPARGGSKRVPKKNTRDFYGFPLIAYSIAAAKLCKSIDRVIVSTDSQEIADIANRFGAEIPFLRPSELARDDSTDIEFMNHAIRWFVENEMMCPAYFVHLRPSTPIRNSKLVDEAVSMIRKDKNSTSLRSGHRCIHPPYKWFISGRDSYWMPLMARSCDEANNPRQDFPDVFIPNGYVDVLKTSFILKNNLMHGERMIGYETDETIDIDSESDFEKLGLYPECIKDLEILREYLGDL